MSKLLVRPLREHSPSIVPIIASTGSSALDGHDLSILLSFRFVMCDKVPDGAASSHDVEVRVMTKRCALSR